MSYFGIAESSDECQLCRYPKASLSLGFKNSTEEDSSLKSATPTIYLLVEGLVKLSSGSLKGAI